MNARINRTWDRNNNRFGFALVCTDRNLNNLWLGCDKAEAQNSVAEVNRNRAALGLSQINLVR